MAKTSSNKSKLTKRILIGVALALVLVYIVFVFITTNFMGNNNIVTETAFRAKAYDTIESKGLIVRDEERLSTNSDGVLVYDVVDGGKVTANGTIATAYASQDDVSAIHQIEQLDQRIEFLESIKGVNNTTNVGIDTVNGQINDRLTALIKNFHNHDYSALPAAEADLLTSILRKQIVTGEQGDFEEKIAALTAERDSIKASTGAPIGTVKTEAAGYFVSKVDGYENCFDVKALDEVTADDVNNAKPEDIDPEAYIGKMLKGSGWYILCPISSDEATSLSHTESDIQVRLPSAMDDPIPAKVVRVNNFGNDGTAVAVLQCNFMNEALSNLRRDNVEIIVNEYEGLKISKSALHDDDVTYYEEDANGNDVKKTARVQGVYVEYGAELVFRQVAILYSGDDYIICNENPASGVLLNGTTVSLYDKVVIEGRDLFDGKIIM